VNLDRLRASYLAQVSAELDRATPEVERGDRLATARAEADRLLTAARASGEKDAADAALRLRAGARREARTEILAARRALYDQLQTAALREALALRSSPRYPQLLDRLASAAKADLGEDAAVDVDPDPVGGMVARSRTRLVDYSLPALTARCVEALRPRIPELWR